jgi:hypothetical protein
MIFRAWRLVVALVVTLVTLASCSSANTPEDSPTSAEAPIDTPAPTSPAARSPAQTSPTAGSPAPSTSSADACVAPARAALQDQDPDDHQVPWKRNGPGKVVITFETKNVPADWVAEMQKGVAAWNKSACLDTKLVETCQPNTNCVTVTVGDGAGADGNFDAVESGGFTTGGHIDLLSTLTGGKKTNVTIHEMGHAVGLAHRLTERVLMNGATYDDVFDPDEVDFQNLLVIYGGQK